MFYVLSIIYCLFILFFVYIVYFYFMCLQLLLCFDYFLFLLVVVIIIIIIILFIIHYTLFIINLLLLILFLFIFFLLFFIIIIVIIISYFIMTLPPGLCHSRLCNRAAGPLEGHFARSKYYKNSHFGSGLLCPPNGAGRSRRPGLKKSSSSFLSFMIFNIISLKSHVCFHEFHHYFFEKTTYV